MHKDGSGIAMGRANQACYMVDGLICNYVNSDRLVVAGLNYEICMEDSHGPCRCKRRLLSSSGR